MTQPATKKTYTATAANGQTLTRTTPRTYTHVVVEYETAETLRALAAEADGIESARKWYEERAVLAERYGGQLVAVIGWAGSLDLAQKVARRSPGSVVLPVEVTS